MARYIDVEALKNDGHPCWHDGKGNIYYEVDHAPTADVVEVKHGYWKDRYGNKYHNHLYECSVCGREALYEHYKDELDQWKESQALTPICPCCSAKMDGGKKE